jgi:hypothetical protein
MDAEGEVVQRQLKELAATVWHVLQLPKVRQAMQEEAPGILQELESLAFEQANLSADELWPHVS